MYIPLNCKTHYSVRQAISKPKDVAARLKEAAIDTCGIADYSIVSGAVQFKNIMPSCIIGTELCDLSANNSLVFAKNYKGWQQLMKITSFANNSNNPCISRTDLLKLLNDDVTIVYLYPENNPVPNSYYGIDINNPEYLNIRKIAEAKGVPAVAVHTSFYSKAADLEDFAILLSIADNLNINLIREKYAHFFNGDKYHILSYQEALDYGYTEEELKHTLAFKQEEYKLNRNPILPKYGDQDSSDELLSKICHDALDNKPDAYKIQLEKELAIIKEYGLSDYFLIVQDIIKYTNTNYGMCGIRGSGAGSVVSFLAGITEVDPIKYNLFFERFMNPGRMSKDHIQLPDIDIDVPAEAREHIIHYIKQKFGYDKVGQILTYQRIKTASAIKAVFRSNNKLSFDEVNQINKLIPEEAKVADKVKDMDNPSLLLYAIEQSPDEFRQWVHINEVGELDGEFKNEFAQALRLEGLNSARSKHAAGVIIGQDSLYNMCPMIWDHSANTTICGLEMHDLEAIGCMKLDILGLRLFDKLIEIGLD